MKGTAFVLSGGGSHGAVQVGMVRGLMEVGIVPDCLYGTSVGALNAAVLAQGPQQESLTQLNGAWARFAVAPPLKVTAATLLRAAARRGPSLFSIDGVREMLDQSLAYSLIEEASVPLRIAATNLLTGEERLFARGPVADALMASCAVPGVFPPVAIEGIPYVDGLVYGAPVQQAIADGHSAIYLLLTSPPEDLTVTPTRWWSVARRAATVIMTRQLTDSARKYASAVDVHTLPAVPMLKTISRRRFESSEALIEAGYRATVDWLRAATVGDIR